MGMSSIDDVLEKITNSDMNQLLQESINHHEKLGNESNSLLNDYGTEEKEPNPISKGMSWMKTNIKLVKKEYKGSSIVR